MRAFPQTSWPTGCKRGRESITSEGMRTEKMSLTTRLTSDTNASACITEPVRGSSNPYKRATPFKDPLWPLAHNRERCCTLTHPALVHFGRALQPKQHRLAQHVAHLTHAILRESKGGSKPAEGRAARRGHEGQRGAGDQAGNGCTARSACRILGRLLRPKRCQGSEPHRKVLSQHG